MKENTKEWIKNSYKINKENYDYYLNKVPKSEDDIRLQTLFWGRIEILERIMIMEELG